MPTTNELIQPKDIEHLLRVLGRKTRHSNLTRRPEIACETIAVSEMLHFLLWLDDDSNKDCISKRVRHYLEMHMRPEDYEAGPPVDRAGLIKAIADKAQENVSQSPESDKVGLLSDALAEIVKLSHYHE
jgi:hypothetical protein